MFLEQKENSGHQNPQVRKQIVSGLLSFRHPKGSLRSRIDHAGREARASLGREYGSTRTGAVRLALRWSEFN